MMRRLLSVCAIFLCVGTMNAQKITGQWRGHFNSNGDIVTTGGENTEYVLEIEINGTEITGFSYSYFQNRRYYVICSLAGTYYKSTKSMKVTETARVKGSTPPDWSDCLQTHILSYQKEEGNEQLAGRWVTAPGQTGNCGVGLTTLTRRTLSKDLSSFNRSENGTPFSSRKPVAAPPAVEEKAVKKPVAPTVAKTVPKPGNTKKPTVPPVAKVIPKTNPSQKKSTPPSIAKTNPVGRSTPEIIAPEKKTQSPTISAPTTNFEKRANSVVKTIEITNQVFKVDLYDNGDIDGDSISLFYNGKLLLSHKRLSDKPISLTLDAPGGDNTNELTMYADNVGSIPPNTALMIVTDGDKRYEVRIASDLKKSGVIRFIHRPANLSTTLQK
ncbi:MAG: hypothetical protein V4725_09715 [Bacteroidota bacterium]